LIPDVCSTEYIVLLPITTTSGLTRSRDVKSTTRGGHEHNVLSAIDPTITTEKMPTLTPSYLPPPPDVASPFPSHASSNITYQNASPEQDVVTQQLDIPLERGHTLKIPCVTLEMPAIREDMAATLAVALLGHVLFLKSQVPLCASHFCSLGTPNS